MDYFSYNEKKSGKPVYEAMEPAFEPATFHLHGGIVVEEGCLKDCTEIPASHDRYGAGIGEKR